MADPNENQALAASLRGAVQSAHRLTDIVKRVDAVGLHGEIGEADLDDLHGLSLANAVAAQALRGFVETMLRRRGKREAVVTAGEGGIDE